MGLMGLMGLVGCSEEKEADRRQHVTMEARPCVQPFAEEWPEHAARFMEQQGITRGWTPPTGYTRYEDFTAEFAEQADLSQKSIGVFFTQDAGTSLQGTFYYNSYISSWRFEADMDLESKSYYLYGFIPKEVAESSSIVANGSYSNGAVLTLRGLRTVTHNDVGIIVGAKNGNDDYTSDGDYTVTGLRAGDFEVAAQATSSSGATGNRLFLLFDHLYSALRFRFRVDAEYAALRTIKLTKLELMAYESLGSTRLKAKYNATVTLAKTDGSTSPIVSVAFTPDNTSSDVAYEPIYTYSGSEGGVTLPSSTDTDGSGNPKYTDFMGCFIPGQNTNFMLRSTYDVYDKAGNLVREGCEAVNNIDLRYLFGITATDLQRGHIYPLALTVRPTYAYVLSDEDQELKIDIKGE